jgi:hypothetical protein
MPDLRRKIFCFNFSSVKSSFVENSKIFIELEGERVIYSLHILGHRKRRATEYRGRQQK